MAVMSGQATLAEPGTDRLRARQLLERTGGGPLSHMTTWHGNRYWFTVDGRAAVAYRLAGGVALTVGDPFGEPAAIRGAAAQFARFCEANGWTPCLYSITEELAGKLAGGRWRLLQVAQEAWISLPGLRFTGRAWQDIRTALNRCRRDGVVAEWVDMADEAAVTCQVRRMSAAWVAGKVTPEMRFTLGGVEELHDPAVRCLVAVDADGQVQAVTSWLPMHRDGTAVGWTLDMMRRRPDASNGIMEFLIASAILCFQAEGAEVLSMSGTPFTGVGPLAGTTIATRALELLGRLLEPVYGFGTLLAFKAKFQPAYRPIYLAYPWPTALPRIAVALVRAYLPALTLRQAARLVASTARRRRLPARRKPAGGVAR